MRLTSQRDNVRNYCKKQLLQKAVIAKKGGPFERPAARELSNEMNSRCAQTTLIRIWSINSQFAHGNNGNNSPIVLLIFGKSID